MSTEVKQILLKLGEGFKAFKKEQTERLDQLEARGNTDPLLEEKVDGAVKKMAEIEKNFDQYVLKANLPGGTGEFTGGTMKATAEEKKGLDLFLRTGDASGLGGKAMEISTPGAGGYAVPDFIDIDLNTSLRDAVALRRVATVKQVESEKYSKIVSRGGFVGGFVGETDARPETGTPTFHEIVAPKSELYANPKLSQRAVDDSGFDVSGFVSSEIQETFSQLEGAAFLTGTGTDEPKGILAYSSTTDQDSTRAFGVLKHTLVAGTTTVTADELQQFVYDLRAPYRKGASWLMNSNTVAVVMGLKDTTGRFLWAESLVAGQPPRLFGYPVEIDENVPDMAAGEVPILFGDFKKGYEILDRIGIRMIVDPFTVKGYVHYYVTKRTSGMLVNDQAIRLLQMAAE